MTIGEKREWLNEYCDNMNGCDDCPLNDFFVHCAFMSFTDEDMFSDEWAEEAYDIAFGSEQPKEEVNHPDRYAGGKFECIDVMLDVFGADAVKHFCILNAFKYIWRAEKKNGIEDIKKAVWYLNKYIELGGERNA